MAHCPYGAEVCLTRQPAHLRALNVEADHAELTRLDLSFLAHRVFLVYYIGTGFELREEASSPPIEKSYEPDWAEIARSAYAVVAEQAGRLVGVAALTVSAWNRRGTVAHLYVGREWRAAGIGTQLMMALERGGAELGVRALWVETQNVNVAAVRFYESCGFMLCGLDTSLYDPELAPGETALYLSKAIGPRKVASVSGDAAAV